MTLFKVQIQPGGELNSLFDAKATCRQEYQQQNTRITHSSKRLNMLSVYICSEESQV